MNSLPREVRECAKDPYTKLLRHNGSDALGAGRNWLKPLTAGKSLIIPPERQALKFP
jgi:hypothetical protein